MGLMGYKQVGKSTAAKYLEEKYGFKRVNFKDALVQEIKDNFPTLLDLLAVLYNMSTDDLFQEKPPMMRALMQNYGTEVRRGDSNSYWTQKWKESAVSSMNIVVDDVRFINEAQAVRDFGGILVRLERPDIISGGTHSSELEHLQIEPDHILICNQGEHELLYKAIDDIVGDLK